LAGGHEKNFRFSYPLDITHLLFSFGENHPRRAELWYGGLGRGGTGGSTERTNQSSLFYPMLGFCYAPMVIVSGTLGCALCDIQFS
jgi:hypothetical protein